MASKSEKDMTWPWLRRFDVYSLFSNIVGGKQQLQLAANVTEYDVLMLPEREKEVNTFLIWFAVAIMIVYNVVCACLCWLYKQISLSRNIYRPVVMIVVVRRRRLCCYCYTSTAAVTVWAAAAAASAIRDSVDCAIVSADTRWRWRWLPLLRCIEKRRHTNETCINK